MASSLVRTFADPDAYSASIRYLSADTTITQRGTFGAKICSIDFRNLWMTRFSQSLAHTMHADGFRATRTTILFPTQPGSRFVMGGTELPWGAIKHLSERSYHLHTFGPTSFGAMSLPAAMMTQLSTTMIGRDLASEDDSLFRPPIEAMARVQRLHEAAGHLEEDAPAVLAHPEAARGLEQALIEALMDCLDSGEISEDTAAQRQHAAIMRRFRRAIEQRGAEPLYLAELCQEIGTTGRTLNSCCQEHLGMAPKRYLLLRRMNLFRSALQYAVARQATVTDIATQHGFWEFGRLAVAYRELFGESPSATLARPA
jgi:AraC-like DNA-binding protein